jgi:Asp-tRNA(Asn)/Glu-tRNA(Gln) amidotransferase A subunit family amidase
LLDYQAPEAVNSVAKVVAFNEQRGAQALGFFGQEYLVLAAELDLDAQRDAYEQALLLSRSLAEQALDRYLLEQQADVIILPSYGPAWPIDHLSGDDFNFGTSAAAAISGYPSITLPATASGVLPMGISLVGLPWSEPVLISLAAELEHSLNGYRRPGYLTQAP